ncbi:MAG: CoA transferase [Acidimicrobiia bacterium]|nr:CoA transferase [Acidimicrobiia bacterium]
MSGTGSLPSVFATTDLAVASVAAAGRAAARVVRVQGSGGRRIDVDRRLASMWFRSTIDPIGWDIPSPWDSVAGVYRAGDRWIRLHTNVPAHRRSALAVLGVDDDSTDPVDRETVTAAAAAWAADELESAIVAAGGCAAALRSEEEWRRHPQGRAVAAEPLIHVERFAGGAAGAAAEPPAVTPGRPLAGVRVLDLTRVLAGPVATRFLAGLGADVLRLDPPDWSEPGVEPDVTRGKRCGRLDLCADGGRATLLRLLADAQILVHGYRADALERLGLGDDVRRTVAPGLIDIGLNAYGWTGPWRNRRGFDSLVQMSCGIAHTGGRLLGLDPRAGGDADQPEPVPLPVQALDHATGYLLATAALHGWAARLTDGGATTARVSLARTAHLLLGGPRTEPATEIAGAVDGDWEPAREETGWGPARRLRPPVAVDGVDWRWDIPAMPLGGEPTLAWLDTP